MFAFGLSFTAPMLIAYGSWILHKKATEWEEKVLYMKLISSKKYRPSPKGGFGLSLLLIVSGFISASLAVLAFMVADS
jgi:hypothetical protein